MERLLREEEVAVGVVNLAEAIDVTLRVHRLPPAVVREALEPLVGDALAVLVHRDPDAWRAAEVRARHYDRRTCPISLADCFLIAASSAGDRIATSDPPLAEAARAEAIDVVALEDSSGRRP